MVFTTETDASLFTYKVNGVIVYFLVCVDDLIVIGNNSYIID